MTIFKDIPPSVDVNVVLTVAQIVAERILALPYPRSLCEIGLDNHDFHWLCDWTLNSTNGSLSFWLDEDQCGRLAFRIGEMRFTRAEAIGILLLLVASEVARREASEGSLWPHVRKVFSLSAQSLLFVSGYPTFQHVRSLEAAARKLALRHVFGVAGTQEYYVSIYLQFGFTKSALALLPRWLVGHPVSKATGILQGDVARLRFLRSRAFEDFWQSLHAYRSNNVTERSLRAVLRASPWVLPEWHDELIRRARVIVKAPAPSGGRGETEFLDAIRFSWNPPRSPQFNTRLTNLVDIGLTSPRYDIHVGDALLHSILRKPDGDYTGGGQEIRLPSDLPAHWAMLTDLEGEIIMDQEVRSWDPVEDVAAFALPSGRAIDAWHDSMRTNSAYGLLLAPDLEMAPAPKVWQIIGNGSRKTVLLAPPWPADLKVLLNGEELWTPHLGQGSRPNKPEPSWASQIRLDGLVSAWLGQSIALEVLGIPASVTLETAACNGLPIDFVKRGQHFALTPVFVSQEIAASGKIVLRLGLRRGNEWIRVIREHPLDCQGMARSSANGWEIIPPTSTLTAQECGLNKYLIYLPGKELDLSDREWSLFEGDSHLRPLKPRCEPIRGLAGFGASLEVRPRYNRTPEDYVLQLAESVVDLGIVKEVEGNVAAGLRIQLREPNELGDHHQVILWSRGEKALQVLDSAHIRAVEADKWEAEAIGPDFTETAVAIAYLGVRIGAWWPRLFPWITLSSNNQTPIETAALIRWYQLPVLAPEYIGGVTRFAQRYPKETLTAWLMECGLPSGLQHSLLGAEKRENWLAAAREIFNTWNPQLEEARQVLRALDQGNNSNAIGSAAVQRLILVDPILMGKVIKGWLTFHMQQGSNPRNIQATIRKIQKEIAGLDEDSKIEAIRGRAQAMLLEAAQKLGVDDNFLSRGVVQPALETLQGKQLSGSDKSNLNTTLNLTSFRECLGLLVLDEMCRTLQEDSWRS